MGEPPAAHERLVPVPLSTKGAPSSSRAADPPSPPTARDASGANRGAVLWIGVAAIVGFVAFMVVLGIGWGSSDRACEVVRATTFCAEWKDGRSVFDAGGLTPGSEVTVVSTDPEGSIVAVATDAGTLAGLTGDLGGPDARYALSGIHRDGTPVTVVVDLR